MVALEDPVGAFISGARAERAPLGEGRLSGLTFAASDVFDVAGSLTTFGNPDWARRFPPARSTAPVILTLLQAGGWLIGKTGISEAAQGLTGENAWYGTPRNPRAPNRYPGGASSGAASAVAAGLVDFAIGVETSASVRLPASYCGLFGMRTSFGAVGTAGVRGWAPSLEAVGCISASAGVLGRVGETIAPPGHPRVAGPLLRVEEAWINAEPEVARALHQALGKLGQRFGRTVAIQLAPEGLDTFYDHLRSVEAEEMWATLGGWIADGGPQLGRDLRAAADAAAAMDPALAVAGRAFRRLAQGRIGPLLAGGAILVFPTSPCPAPLLTASLIEQDAVREATLGVMSLAAFCGLPEVTLPVAQVKGAPVGLSFAVGAGQDRGLLAFAQEAASILELPV